MKRLVGRGWAWILLCGEMRCNYKYRYRYNSCVPMQYLFILYLVFHYNTCSFYILCSYTLLVNFTSCVPMQYLFILHLVFQYNTCSFYILCSYTILVHFTSCVPIQYLVSDKYILSVDNNTHFIVINRNRNKLKSLGVLINCIDVQIAACAARWIESHSRQVKWKNITRNVK